MVKKIQVFGIVLGFLFIVRIVFILLTLDMGFFEIELALVFSIILYFQSFGEFFFFFKKRGRPRLQDWMRIVLFYSIVWDYIKRVTGVCDTHSTFLEVSSLSIDMRGGPAVFMVLIIAFLIMDFVDFWFTQEHRKGLRVAERHGFFIQRQDFVIVSLCLISFIRLILLLSGIVGFGSEGSGGNGIISLVSNIVNYVNSFFLIISAFVFFTEGYRKKLYCSLFKIMFFLQVFMGLISGMKEYTLIPILYVGVVFLLTGHKIEIKYLFIASMFLVFLYPVNNVYRKYTVDPTLNTGSKVNNFISALNDVLQEPIVETLKDGTESYGDRSSVYWFFQRSIEIEPQWNYYKYLKRYLYLPISFLPRFIIKSKPTADIGGEFYKVIHGYNDNVSITPMNIGWAYLEGGIHAVIIVFSILGLVLFFVDNVNFFHPLSLVVYIRTFHSCLKPEWDTYFFLADMIQAIIVFYFLSKLIKVRKRDCNIALGQRNL